MGFTLSKEALINQNSKKLKLYLSSSFIETKEWQDAAYAWMISYKMKNLSNFHYANISSTLNVSIFGSQLNLTVLIALRLMETQYFLIILMNQVAVTE